MKFDVLLFDDFSNHCLANTVEPLRAANALSGQTLYQWRFLTIDGQPVSSSSGLQVTPQSTLRHPQGDLLIVMPSYGVRALDTPDIAKQLRLAAGRYEKLAGLDTGSWLLARAGLLDGYQATIHWDEMSSFAEAFPDIDIRRERFIVDRDRITCSGAMTAFDLTMHLVAEAHGKMLAMEVAQLFMMHDMARSPVPDASVSGKTVDRAVRYMRDNLENPLPIAAVAKHVGCSQKTLETRMKAALGAGPQSVYQRLRLNLARKLVADTEQSIAEIASRCGYENASAMTRAFKAAFGVTPRNLRHP
jgi:transcriptional regulator GlxA family with amidase domain